MSHVTNMANTLLDNILKRGCWVEICPSITRGDHLVICPLRWLNTTIWHYVRQDCVCGHLNVCMSFMHIPRPQRDPVPLLCSILINPALTEWTWQVMYVLGLGWEGSEEKEHDSGVNAKPTKRHNTASSRSTLGQVRLVGSPANSLTTQSYRLSPQIQPAWPEREKHMASVDSGKCYEFLIRTIKPNIYLCLNLSNKKVKMCRLVVCSDCLLISLTPGLVLRCS